MMHNSQEDSNGADIQSVPASIATIHSQTDPILSTHASMRRCCLSGLWLTSAVKLLSIFASFSVVALLVGRFDEICESLLPIISAPFGLAIPEIISAGFEPFLYRDQYAGGTHYKSMIAVSIVGVLTAAFKMTILATLLQSYPDNSSTCELSKLVDFPWIAFILLPSFVQIFAMSFLLFFFAIE